MSQSLQVVFPYQWGYLTLAAPDGVQLDPTVAVLQPDVFCVQPTIEGWAELRGKVLAILANLPPVVSVQFTLEGPKELAGDDPMALVKHGLSALGWSHEDLAHNLGVTANTVWRWFSGRTPMPPWVQAYMTMAIRSQAR